MIIPRNESAPGGSRAFLFAALGLLATAMVPSAALAQPELGQASMRQGDADAAETAWSNVLVRDPVNLEALIGRGTARGWKQDWTGAETDLSQALAISPNSLEALNAMAYVMAWSGRYGEAERYFNRMLALAPDNVGAQKGLAYTAFWAGRSDAAEERFQRIAYAFPDDPEPMVGVGKARLADGYARGAASAYRDALARDPASAEARSGLRAAQDYPALAELSVWAGDPSGGGEAGLRIVELGSWVTPETKVWARYDDGLSLDNPVLARTGADATTWSIGARRQFGPSVIALVEAGYRDLPAGENQEIYKAEGVYLSPLGASKLGVQISPHSAGFTDRLFYAGQSVRLGGNFTVEPTVYIARTGAARDDEWRAVGYGEYSNGDIALGLGIGGGGVSSVNPLADGSIFAAFANASVRVGGWHRLHLSVTREETPLVDFTRVLVGVTLRLPRN